MPNVRFVEGSADSFSVVYDTEWPIAPRVGEFLQIVSGSDQELTWKVTRVCHVANAKEELIGTMAWIEQVRPGYNYSLDNL